MKLTRLLGFVALAFCSCHRSTRSEKPVGDDFLGKHPSCTLVSIDDAETDGDTQHSKISIHYRLPNDATLHEEVWHYKSVGHLKWELTHKESKQ